MLKRTKIALALPSYMIDSVWAAFVEVGARLSP